MVETGNAKEVMWTSAASAAVQLADGEPLPLTLSGREAAEMFGCSYWSLLQQVKRGDCPVMPLRLGRNLRWPTAQVLAVLGVAGS